MSNIEKKEQLYEGKAKKVFATNDPKKMKESYMKAMEMLKEMGMNGVKK